MRKWMPMAVLGTAMLVTVFDSALLGVAITQLTEDLNTDTTRVQLIVTMLSLTVGAFLLATGKVGDRIGRKRAFAVGCVVYAVGSAIAMAATTVWVALLGWSILKGIAAALMLPTIAALIPFNYEGNDRNLAFAMIGGIGGGATAIGLTGGGWATTELSWRWVHAVQIVLIVLAFLGLRFVRDSPPAKGESIDIVGAVLSVVGLGAIVYGVLQSSEWGFFAPRNSPVEPFGMALTPFVIIGGALVLAAFAAWQRQREARNKPPLLKIDLFQNPLLRGPLIIDFAQALIIGGAFFVLPMYLQVVAGEDALGTGIRLLPMSVALLITSIGAAPITAKMAPRIVVRAGLSVMIVGLLLAMWAVDLELKGFRFGAALAVLGIGLGILASVLSGLIQGAVGDADRSEVSGLANASSKLGNATGTALLGAVLIAALSGAWVDNFETDPRVPDDVAADAAVDLDGDTQFIPASFVREALDQGDLEPEVADGIFDSFETAQIQGLRAALLVAVLLGLLGLGFSRTVSDKKPDQMGAQSSPERSAPQP